MESKENRVLKVFFEQPTRQWHFNRLEKEIHIAPSKLTHWLKKFRKEELILKIKPKNRMPYYQANYEHPNYRNRKRLFALNQLYESGLLNYLTSLDAESVILFGSFARSDWYQESDLDLFIYKNNQKLDLGKYQSKLHRPLQVFTGRNVQDLKKMGAPLLRNILKGVNLKGTVPLKLIKHAL